ncbi:hypothetical protein [Dyadobacter sp. 32]|uniref:hypothetical protein n=1 Tax=Dyadobacter sp. 32 TaxID=538966 RepID=UPI0011EF6C09
MLKPGRLLVAIVFFQLIFSCKDDKKQNQQNAGIDRNKLIEYSKIHFGESNYSDLYKAANDSLNSWIGNKLSASKMQRYSNWQLDSLLCFNIAKNKCIMAIANQESETVNNSIIYFYGVKINKQWYFFYGPTMYPDPFNHNPLPFAKLHEIAMDDIFKGYLKKNEKSGKWEINEGFFSRFYERDAYNFPFTTQEAWEESWLKLMRENWEKRDTTNYKLLQ